MAIVINGTGSIAGLSVGGLPDDTVDEGSLANSINTSIGAKLPLAGGTMTGNLQVNGTFKSRSIDDTDNASGTAITIYDSEEVKLHNMVEIHTAKTAVPTYSAIRLQSPVDAIGQLVGQTYVLNGVAGRPRAAIFAKAELANGYAASLTFMTRSAEDGSTLHATDNIRMTILSGGNVGIGTTSPDEKLDVEGTVQISRTSGYTGTWKQFLSQASSATNGTLYFDGSTSTGGVIFRPNGSQTVSFPVAGGITFGSDTAAANALNDYEEGNHAAAFTAASSGSITIGRNDLGYTKIGNMVHCTGEISVSSVSSPNGGTRLSLPFAIASHTVDRNMNWGGQGMICYSVAHYEDNPPCLFASAGTSYVALLYQRDDAAFYDYNAAAGDTFMFSFSYKTDS